MDDVENKVCNKENNNNIKNAKIKISKEKIINILVFIIFVEISLIIGMKHEPWADEAQSWLIARDNNIIEIFQMIKNEGTPALWPLVLKFFISLGLNYKYFCLISILFTSIGVYLILFKIKMPQILKVLLPFSYFIMYQYNIVSRSYCLILPIFCFIILNYEKKRDKPFIYTFLLILLMSVSAHTYIIAGCLFFDYFIDIISNRKDKNMNIKKIMLSIIIICVAFLLTLMYFFPGNNSAFEGNSGRSISTCISNALFSSKLYTNNYDLLIVILLVFLFFIKYDFKKSKMLFLVIVAPLIITSIVHTEVWHFGVIFLGIIFVLIVTEMIEDKLIKIVLIGICIIQIPWSIQSSLNDYNNTCSANIEIVNLLEENNYKEKTVYGVGYNAMEINPYFHENIYKNYNSNKGYYNWKKENGYMTLEEMKKNLPDIIIMQEYDVFEFIEYMNLYTVINFPGDVFVKNESYINNNVMVWIRK